MELGKHGRELRIKMPSQDEFLSWMYGHALGRLILKPLVSPAFSKLGGAVLDSGLSAPFIGPFIEKNGISMDECEETVFHSFNDFFKRKLQPEARPLCAEEGAFISPCDSRLSVYPIREDSHFLVKDTPYTVESLLKNKKLAERYAGGTLWLLRLCVDDYHRYIYPVTGRKSANIKIPGVFHTVNPVANDVYPIYKENTREFCLIKTEDCGTVLMMEVGAMLVGKIENRESGAAEVQRGEEKGNFAFGGSTILLLTEKGQVLPELRFTENTENGIETRVRLGEKIGEIL
ncbi:MAG: phosphatidylserine decarboxylase [Clostridiales bacterium]|nr:phosphatidylserine decarboxylase [Candidatus Blautia equi]